MPLLFRRRRPLMRGAMIGGTAYLAGKAGARAQERNDAEQAQQAPPAPAASGGSDIVGELTKLKGLLDAGVLTPDEFQAAKQRVLSGG